MNQKFLKLAQRLTNELGNLDRAIQDAQAGWQRFTESSDRLYLSVVALNLHSFYTGLETLFELIANILKERLTQSSNWHEALLQQMAVELPGIRPAVISPSSRDALDEYRKFRHLVRNIYPFMLDSARIQPLVEAAPNTFGLVRSDLLNFASFLSLKAQPNVRE